jgi:RHH-type rel operon transcriptional repressor/antitoxin RelB
LPPEIGKRLAVLAEKTGRTKSFHAREAILRHIEDLKDGCLAGERLNRGAGRSRSVNARIEGDRFLVAVGHRNDVYE